MSGSASYQKRITTGVNNNFASVNLTLLGCIRNLIWLFQEYFEIKVIKRVLGINIFTETYKD